MSLKKRLAQAEPRTAEHRLRITDDREPWAVLAAAQASGDAERIAAAQAAWDACYETLQLRAMPLPDWDDLVTRHPPTDDARKLGRWCEQQTFVPAALAVCVLDSDVTEADWADYVKGGAIAPGEVQALQDDLLALHDRTADLGSLGKG